MISDEQRKAFEKWAKPKKFNLDAYADGTYMNYRTHFAYMGWQAAQEVKPLELGDNFYLLRTRSVGHSAEETVIGWCCDFNGEKIGDACRTEAEAIEAVNQYNRKRVLSCLVNGGV